MAPLCRISTPLPHTRAVATPTYRKHPDQRRLLLLEREHLAKVVDVVDGVDELAGGAGGALLRHALRHNTRDERRVHTRLQHLDEELDDDAEEHGDGLVDDRVGQERHQGREHPRTGLRRRELQPKQQVQVRTRRRA